MENPFVFGRLSDTGSFVNRVDDIHRLKQNTENKINTILLSPRRWGKSSLISVLEYKAGLPKNTVFCHFDMFNINREDDFYNQYSNEILRATSSKIEETVAFVRSFLSSLKPNLSFENNDTGKISFEISHQKDDTTFLDVLNLPENIAKKKKIHLVVCIDEFQNLSRFRDPLLFQQRLRANWQHHKNVTYIVYGSKRSMLSELFEKQSMPFYRFGDVFYLKKIEASHWIKFIRSSFRKTGKKIAKKYAEGIAELMECHSYYVQQFAHIIWNNTGVEVDDAVYNRSQEDIIGRNSLMFESIYENLSYYQVKVLAMVVEDPNAQLTSTALIKKYDLGTSSNVIQSLKSLENKEIIDRFEGRPQIIDPVFKLWFRQRILKQ
jgi:AAA+ ATPase superfamily predicted ATPase